jgi:hypothetical protein
VLTQLIGELVNVAGPVRIERRVVPSLGHLLVTTGGLMFLPRLHRRLNGAVEEVTSQRSPGWWPFQGEQSSSRFLAWLRRSTPEASANGSSAEHPLERASEPLAERLMESPGAFFVARLTIQAITARRRQIQINRAPSRSIALSDETDDGSVMAALYSLRQQIAGL